MCRSSSPDAVRNVADESKILSYVYDHSLCVDSTLLSMVYDTTIRDYCYI